MPPKAWELAIFTLNIALIAGVGASLFAGNEEKAVIAPLGHYELQYAYVRYAVLVVSAALAARQMPTSWQSLFRPWPIWLACLLIFVSATWSIDSRATIVNAGQLFLMVLFATGAVSRFGLASISRPMRIIGWAIVMTNLLLLLQQPAFAYHQDANAGAFRGLFVHKNTLGQFGMCTIIAIAPSFFQSRKTSRHMFDLVLVALSLVTVAVSQSASGLVISVCALLYVLFLGFITRIALPYTVNVILIFLTFSTLVLVMWLWQDAILGLINRDATLTGRTALWEATWKAIRERPILGFGFSAFWESEQGAEARFGDTWIPSQAHNGYMQSLLDGGPLLLALVLIHISLLLRHTVLHSLYRASPGGVFVSAVSLSLPLYNMVEAVFIQVNSMPTLLLVAALPLTLSSTTAPAAISGGFRPVSATHSLAVRAPP